MSKKSKNKPNIVCGCGAYIYKDGKPTGHDCGRS